MTVQKMLKSGFLGLKARRMMLLSIFGLCYSEFTGEVQQPHIRENPRNISGKDQLFNIEDRPVCEHVQDGGLIAGECTTAVTRLECHDDVGEGLSSYG